MRSKIEYGIKDETSLDIVYLDYTNQQQQVVYF